MVAQIRFIELLREDQFYRAWFQKVPTLKYLHPNPPWRLFVQVEEHGRWKRGDFRKYTKAYAQAKLRLPDVWDLTIHSKSQHFRPPILRIGSERFNLPMPVGHAWCTLCRRPTVFYPMAKHPNLPFVIDTEAKRCKICGLRQDNIKKYRTPLVWPVSLERQS